jgi:hypothetical protein
MHSTSVHKETLQPAVVVTFLFEDGTAAQAMFSPEEAREHGQATFEAAEAAASDSAIMQVMRHDMGAETEVAVAFMDAVRNKRRPDLAELNKLAKAKAPDDASALTEND